MHRAAAGGRGGEVQRLAVVSAYYPFCPALRRVPLVAVVGPLGVPAEAAFKVAYIYGMIAALHLKGTALGKEKYLYWGVGVYRFGLGGEVGGQIARVADYDAHLI